MTMDALFNNVENAISQYEQACEQEEMLYDMMREAENDMNRYSAQASSSEDASEQRAALEQTKAAVVLSLTFALVLFTVKPKLKAIGSSANSISSVSSKFIV